MSDSISNAALLDSLFHGLDVKWADLTRSVYFDHQDKFDKWPASCGKHHSYEGGLFRHSLETSITAKMIAYQYQLERDPNKDDAWLQVINVSLTVSAAFLHDIGKVVEYQRDPAEPHGFGKTKVGRLHHHIPIGYALLGRYLDKLDVPQEDKDNFLHAVLAHHGRLEWHSPVLCQTSEAFIVHSADCLSAYLTSFKERGKLHGAD